MKKDSARSCLFLFIYPRAEFLIMFLIVSDGFFGDKRSPSAR
ncbi:MAG TPA: hypothetical protein VF721_00955 [Pyrinomonadaceae bacterium]